MTQNVKEIKTSKPKLKQIAQEKVDTIQKMVDDRDLKCERAKEQLVENLKITADKYRTATGVMEALRVMRMVNDGPLDNGNVTVDMAQAREIAAAMVQEVSNLTNKAESLGWAEMDKLCEGAYEEDFISGGFSAMDLAFELMRIDLCRNIGPAAQDMVDFLNRAEEQIRDVQAELDALCEKHPEFKELKPTVVEE